MAKSRLLLVVLALIGSASLILSLPTGNPQLRIQFTGICDFIPASKGNLEVILPDAASELMKDQKAHRAFIRIPKKTDVRVKSTSQFDIENTTYGALLLHDEKISLAGPFQTAPLQLAPSYFRLVPDMLGQGLVLASPLPPTARMLLDKGMLSAPAESPSSVLLPLGVTPTPEQCKAAHPLARIVELILPLRRNAAERSFAITAAGPTRTRTLTFEYGESSDIEILIGNVPEDQIIEPPKQPTPRPQDTDFQFHYKLAGGRADRAAARVPTSCVAVPITGWEPCYVASWGTTGQ
jgi:hypothetical protein